VIRLQGNPWRYADALSFYWSWREIWGDEIYLFPSPRTSPRIIDGGANLGLATLFFLQKYPGARVTAVEPDPTIFSLLQQNLESWKNENLLLLPCALAATPGKRPFQSRGADAGRLDLEAASAASLEVECLALDDLLTEPVDFLKLDLEGAETEVLEASHRLDRVEFLFVEHHSFAGSPRNLERLLSVLSRSGFTYWIRSQFLPDRPWERIQTNEGMDLQVNIFAKRISA